jgi:MFS family permease
VTPPDEATAVEVPPRVAAEETRGGWRRVALDTTPLRHPAYRSIFIGTVMSYFGTQLTAVAVPVQMYALTRSSLWVGLIGIAGLVPLLVFALWGGALADVLDRRRLLLASSLATWAVTLALLVQGVLALHSPWLLLVLVAVQSAAVSVTMPTRNAIIPRLVPKDDLAAANTLNFTASTAATVAGPLVAGVLIGYHISVAYAVDAVTFTVALWAALRLPPLPPERDRSELGRGGLADVLFGLRYLAGKPILLLSFGCDIVAMVFAQPRALFPQVAAQRFGGSGAVGWLYAAISIGSLLAGLTSGWIGRIRRQGWALVAAVVAWGIAIGFAGLAGSLWLVVLLLAVGGAADLVSAVYRQTILQTYAPDELRGRLQGVFTAVVAGGPRLGDLRAGATGAALGTTVAWAGGGFAASVVVVLLAVAFPALVRYRTA